MEHVDHVVVGLGALGSATAYQLAARGADVLGLEQFELGHVRGASHDTSRIIRRAYDRPEYVRLADAAYRDWADFEDLTGEHLVTRTGGITFCPPDAPVPVEHYLDSLQACGVEHRALDRAAPGSWPRSSPSLTTFPPCGPRTPASSTRPARWRPCRCTPGCAAPGSGTAAR